MRERKERMSKNDFSLKRVKPVIIIDEDDERRDLFGRKRVDVIECLLESSSHENDETNIFNQNSNNILWLTFPEICHIRSVLAGTLLSTLMFNKDKQYSKIIHGDVCFRCRKPINSLFFIPSFLYSINCSICQQRICKKCSLPNFLPPLSTHLLPVRIQALIKSSSSSISIENETINKNKSNTPICYDCSQVIRQSFISPTLSSKLNTHPSVHIFNGKTTLSDT